jgi:hypothetical protein
MAKFTITRPDESRIVSAEEFTKLPDGTLGKIVRDDDYDDTILVKEDLDVISLSGNSGWSDFGSTGFEVEVLPKGTAVTLTQE